MDEFENLSWRISDPSALDIGTSFIKDENITKTFLYKDNLKPYNFSSHEETKKKIDNHSNIMQNRYPKTSCLNKMQHLQCLKALQCLQIERPLSLYSQQEQQLINIYKNLKIEIHEENNLFLNFVEQQWKKKLHKRTKRILPRMFNFATTKWKNHLEKVKSYDEYYEVSKMISLSTTENPVEMNHGGCLLELGTVPNITLPNLENKEKMCINTLPSKKACPSDEILEVTKLSASQDCYAEELAKQNNCDIVITSSGLKTIIDNYGPDYSAAWDIPVIIKEYDENNCKKKVIYIEKPLPQRNITFRDLNTKCRKVLLKTNHCKTVAHSFQTPEKIFELYNSYKSAKTNQHNDCKKIKTTKPNPLPTPPSKIITRSVAKQLTNTLPHNSDDELIINEQSESNIESNLVEELGKNSKTIPDVKIEDNNDNVKKKDEKRNKFGNISMHHNVSYRLWKLNMPQEKNTLIKGFSENKEIKLLVRCKTDGSQVDEKGILHPVSLIPKIEYQYEHGGEMFTRSEILRQWTTLYFRPFSNLLRVRINSTNNVYMKVENINLNNIMSESLKHYNVTPTLSLGVLYNVLSNLINEASGNYLLHHSPKEGSFATLMKSVPSENTAETFNLHSLYCDKNCKIENVTKWYAIDTTFILPYHVEYGLMPALFPPAQNVCKSRRGKKKRKTQKKAK